MCRYLIILKFGIFRELDINGVHLMRPLRSVRKTIHASCKLIFVWSPNGRPTFFNLSTSSLEVPFLSWGRRKQKKKIYPVVVSPICLANFTFIISLVILHCIFHYSSNTLRPKIKVEWRSTKCIKKLVKHGDNSEEGHCVNVYFFYKRGVSEARKNNLK